MKFLISLLLLTSTAFAEFSAIQKGVNNQFSVLQKNGSMVIFNGKVPTFTTFFSAGSGTYIVPPGVTWLRVRAVGGGAGGWGSGTASGSSPTAAGNTTFGSTLIIANGGAIATGNSGFNAPQGGIGGTCSLGTGIFGMVVQGGQGGGSQWTNTGVGPTTAPLLFGGSGGISALGGMGSIAGTPTTGPVASSNSGMGGPGGNGLTIAAFNTGAGGGGGCFADAIIGANAALAASYAYNVGAAGAAGGAGTSGNVGIAGAAGGLWIEEHYGN